MSTSVRPYTTGFVSSADGTAIWYRKTGSGPGVILLSGGYLAAQHYMYLDKRLMVCEPKDAGWRSRRGGFEGERRDRGWRIRAIGRGEPALLQMNNLGPILLDWS